MCIFFFVFFCLIFSFLDVFLCGCCCIGSFISGRDIHHKTGSDPIGEL